MASEHLTVPVLAAAPDTTITVRDNTRPGGDLQPAVDGRLLRPVLLEAGLAHPEARQAAVERLEAEPDPDHEAEADHDRGEEEEEEEEPHVGSRVQLQVDDTELTALPGRAQVLHRITSQSRPEFPLLKSISATESEEYSPLALSIPTSDKS